jgi:hypothetical protein
MEIRDGGAYCVSPADALLSGSTSDFAPAILSAATKFGVRIITFTIPGALQRFDALSWIHMALFAGTLTVASTSSPIWSIRVLASFELRLSTIFWRTLTGKCSDNVLFVKLEDVSIARKFG